MILEPKRRKSVTVSTFSFSICREVMGQDAMILAFRMLSFKSAFSLSVVAHVLKWLVRGTMLHKKFHPNLCHKQNIMLMGFVGIKN